MGFPIEAGNKMRHNEAPGKMANVADLECEPLVLAFEDTHAAIFFNENHFLALASSAADFSLINTKLRLLAEHSALFEPKLLWLRASLGSTASESLLVMADWDVILISLFLLSLALFTPMMTGGVGLTGLVTTTVGIVLVTPLELDVANSLDC
jgi:hypothetical protein